MVYIFKNNKNIPSAYRDSLSKYIQPDEVERLNRPVEIQHVPVTELLKNYSLNEPEKLELLKLYEHSKNKLVFHDFWLLGCAPCMAEFPHYNRLIEAAGNTTEFIFFAAYMNREDWERTIQKFNLKGKHYLLSKNQLAFFEKYFGLMGFPHHQVLNKRGEIVRQHIPLVQPENQKFIVELLEKMIVNGQ
jgi:thiol-disulfide isomerase/thioredoxin